VGFRYSSNVGARGSVVAWLETRDYIGYLYDILGYFCILKGVYHSLPFLHTQEGEATPTVFVTTYRGFPILNTTHINQLSLLLYDEASFNWTEIFEIILPVLGLIAIDFYIVVNCWG
jgi:hypothetical protein